MYINRWQWFDNFEQQAYLKHDTLRVRLTQYRQKGWYYIKIGQLENARLEYIAGTQLAQQLQEPWWIFFYEYWQGEVIIAQRRYSEAQKMFTRLVSQTQHPELAEHPFHAAAYYNLAQLYYIIDKLGYQPEIYAALKTIESEVPLDYVTHQRLMYLYVAMLVAREEWDNAYTKAQGFLDMIQDSAFRQRSAYDLLGQIHLARHELEAALEYHRLREQAGHVVEMLRDICYAILSQSICAAYLGRTAAATVLHQRGLQEYDSLQLERETDFEFYDLMAEYLEVCGKAQEALALRDKQLAAVQISGSLDAMFFCRLSRCYLLNRLQRPPGDDLTALRDLALQHRKPDYYLQKVAQIEQGRPARFDWQVQFYRGES